MNNNKKFIFVQAKYSLMTRKTVLTYRLKLCDFQKQDTKNQAHFWKTSILRCQRINKINFF